MAFSIARQSPLSVEHVTKRFGRTDAVVALDDVSIHLEGGEMLVLLGPSGCGKTTLLRSIAGLEEPTSGRVVSGDRVLVDTDAGINVPVHKRNVGMVFQNYSLWPHMKVIDNVAYPLRARRVPKQRAYEEARRVLDLLQCNHLVDRYPGQLSGGQQQRIAVGRSLMGSPSTILFDEPLSNLDEQLRRDVRAEIHRLHAAVGFTGVYVTHDQREGLEIGDRIAVMRTGQIEQVGTPVEVYESPKSAYVARFFGIENSIVCRWEGTSVVSSVGKLAGGWNELIPTTGGPFEVLFRSLGLRFVKPDASDSESGAQASDCTIEDSVLVDRLFSGSTTQNIVEVGDTRLVATIPRVEETDVPAVGDRLQCRFRSSEAFVFPVDPVGDGDGDSGRLGARTAAGEDQAHVG